MPFIPKIKKTKRKRVEKDRFNSPKAKAIRKIRNTSIYIHTMLHYKQNNPLCEKCLEMDRVTLAEDVHHKLPLSKVLNISDLEYYALSEFNLSSLCKNCHRDIHRELK